MDVVGGDWRSVASSGAGGTVGGGGGVGGSGSTKSLKGLSGKGVSLTVLGSKMNASNI
jgi:hypothetical protein